MGNVPKSRESIQNYRTPRPFWDWLNEMFAFTLDAAADEHNALCPKYYTEATNGLAQSWAGEVVWVNPPFKQIKKWLEKAEHAADFEDATVVMLLPAALETRWFRYYGTRGDIAILTPRLPYIHPDPAQRSKKKGPPLGSMLVVFRPGIIRAANDDFHATILEIPEPVIKACRAILKEAA